VAEKTGIELIAEERKRQVEKEGWTAEHDAQHVAGELSMAAACYAHRASLFAIKGRDYATCHRTFWPIGWPWLRESWKPKTVLKDLIRAGALIAAEIDRLQRMEK